MWSCTLVHTLHICVNSLIYAHFLRLHHVSESAESCAGTSSVHIFAYG